MTEQKAPKGLLGFLLILGPSLIWCGEYIGSGEVILATRAGAIFGTVILWTIVIGIFFKFWIGLCAARYTVITGEGMVDLFTRVPGPKNWLVWIVLFGQAAAGICSIGAIATAAATFLDALLPMGNAFGDIPWWGIIVVCFTVTITWTGGFKILKITMSILVGMVVIGVLYVALHCLPDINAIMKGMFGFQIPEIPEWVSQQDESLKSKWSVILPLLGWAAGGFASQVWYTYWVLGAGYGMAKDREWGQRADEERLKKLTREDAQSLKPWLKAVAWDATVALIIGTGVTLAFMIAGAGVLGAQKILPGKSQLVETLSKVFSDRWSHIGGTLFILAGATAMISTQLGQLAGWPRLLADCVRNIFKGFGRVAPKKQFRIFLTLFLVTNLLILSFFGKKPLLLVTMGSITDGLILVPLQALAVFWVIFFELKKMLSPEAWKLLKPRWYHAAGLFAAFAIFAYFCIFQVPSVLSEFIAKI